MSTWGILNPYMRYSISGYTTQRHQTKKEEVNAIEGTLLHYVKKKFAWAAEVYTGCVVGVASNTLFEVEYNTGKIHVWFIWWKKIALAIVDSWLVYHAIMYVYAIIIDNRGCPNTSFHEYYSMAWYAKAYALGVNQWYLVLLTGKSTIPST